MSLRSVGTIATPFVVAVAVIGLVKGGAFHDDPNVEILGNNKPGVDLRTGDTWLFAKSNAKADESSLPGLVEALVEIQDAGKNLPDHVALNVLVPTSNGVMERNARLTIARKSDFEKLGIKFDDNGTAKVPFKLIQAVLDGSSRQDLDFFAATLSTEGASEEEKIKAEREGLATVAYGELDQGEVVLDGLILEKTFSISSN